MKLSRTLQLLPGLATIAVAALSPSAALAHVTDCPVCGLKVVQGTKSQDNEVVLRNGKKKIEYRCIYCALADAKKYEGDLIVYSPSETQVKPVIRRADGKWSVVKEQNGTLILEEGAVFLNDFKSHQKCAMLSRAFHSMAAFEKYAAANKALDAKALTLEEMVAAAGKHG